MPRLLLLTTEHLVLADPKAAQPKMVLSLCDIQGASVSRFSDGLLALHLKEVWGHTWGGRGGGQWGLRNADPTPKPHPAPQTSTAGGKGDLLLVSPHLIELVTRLHQTLMDATAQALPLSIADQYTRGWGRGLEGAWPGRAFPEVGVAWNGAWSQLGVWREGWGKIWLLIGQEEGVAPGGGVGLEAAHWAAGGCGRGAGPDWRQLIGQREGRGRACPHPFHPFPPISPRFSTRFPKGDVAVTVVESAKGGGDVPVCKKRGSHKMEILVH